MVLQGLVKPELSVSSVSTLKRICRECRHDLGPYAQDILTVSQVRHAASRDTKNHHDHLKRCYVCILIHSVIVVFVKVLTLVFFLQDVVVKEIHKVSKQPLTFASSILFCKH